MDLKVFHFLPEEMYNHYLLPYLATNDLLISKITKIPGLNFLNFNNSLDLVAKISLLESITEPIAPKYFLQSILDRVNSPVELEYLAKIVQNKFNINISTDLSLIMTRKDRLRLSNEKL